MAAANYANALKRVLVYEGGKVDHPKDPGGRTNQGVIQRVYNGWRKKKGLPQRDVYQMEPHERDDIYRVGYWDLIQGDKLPAGIDFVVFDGAVNSGATQSVKWLQRALKMTRVDGDIGAATLGAIEAHPDHDLLIRDILDRRMYFLKALKTWKTFGKGWTSRVDQVRNTGQAWATGSVGPVPFVVAGMERKASIEDAKTLPTKAPGDAATGAGTASGGIAGTIQATRDSIEPLVGAAPWLGHIVAGLAVASAVLIIGGLLYRKYMTKEAQALADVLDLPSGVAA